MSSPSRIRYLLNGDDPQIAGIDVTEFTANSCRGAGLIVGHRRGASIVAIVKQRDWRNTSTFKKYYEAPLSRLN